MIGHNIWGSSEAPGVEWLRPLLADGAGARETWMRHRVREVRIRRQLD